MNTMQSDTPRTHAHLKTQNHTYSPSVSIEFARMLEREIIVQAARISELEAGLRQIEKALANAHKVHTERRVNYSQHFTEAGQIARDLLHQLTRPTQ